MEGGNRFQVYFFTVLVEAVLLSGLPACYLAQLSSNSMKCLPDLLRLTETDLFAAGIAKVRQ
jgi:hypothetical protein